jgi:hypothetical protein
MLENLEALTNFELCERYEALCKEMDEVKRLIQSRKDIDNDYVRNNFPHDTIGNHYC